MTHQCLVCEKLGATNKRQHLPTEMAASLITTHLVRLHEVNEETCRINFKQVEEALGKSTSPAERKHIVKTVSEQSAVQGVLDGGILAEYRDVVTIASTANMTSPLGNAGSAEFMILNSNITIKSLLSGNTFLELLHERMSRHPTDFLDFDRRQYE
ncbi:hypothetical protein BU16DRAFT_12366 [Lophium mytilinum]|uniref:Uncharacterized protein n=1 Tax=Lophium mytilinum TaxID=390894 RepID=A0A6A6RD01_9PEZI|nr:hypothetical protein BU16DRAFT_12366 [Lophium mytilinum]